MTWTRAPRMTENGPARWELASWRLHDAVERLARRNPARAVELVEGMAATVERELPPASREDLTRWQRRQGYRDA